MWEIDFTHILPWLKKQDRATRQGVFAAVECLAESGPSLGRPLVDSIKGSAYKNMKELRPASPGSSEVRILFAFDPRRRAILLFAGDKSLKAGFGRSWSDWYPKAIAEADAIYRRYLEESEQRDD